MNETEEYKKINDKVIKIIEENYSKDFYKAMRTFKIIMVGYIASEYKNFQTFDEYGWEMIPMIGADLRSYLFKKEISLKVSIELILVKNNMNGLLVTGKIPWVVQKGYIIIKVDKMDELFEQIKSLEKFVYFDTRNRFGNEILNYEIVSRNEDGNGYTLKVSYPCSL